MRLLTFAFASATSAAHAFDGFYTWALVDGCPVVVGEMSNGKTCVGDRKFRAIAERGRGGLQNSNSLRPRFVSVRSCFLEG